MDAETWNRLGGVFHAVISMPEDQQSSYLDEACDGDVAFRDELEAMLRAHRDSGSDDSIIHVLPRTGRTAERLGEGSLLGPYRLEEVVGRGGMGEVYRAVRVDDQFKRQVAIKVLRPDRASSEVVRRFLQERQILAQLEHPSIVTMLDGGLSPAGHPYLVMQFVDGVPITAFAERSSLTIRDRLELFVAVCDAVQFAHTHLVVHRDLKPSNILIAPDGKPRLLDFGIAKLLDPSEATPATGDALLLTPEHAAPEQFSGKPVTTATDVYALGVLLYELLTGTRPFRHVAPSDLPRAVSQDPPRPPSDHRAVDRDLDQIVLMALRKEPARRYASAGQLSEDVSRFLGGWPVRARPDTAYYRFRRFVSRNSAAIAATATVILALVSATAWTARQSAQRAAALEVATSERARAGRITNFLLGVFRATNPSETRGRTVTARELLDQAAQRVATDLAQEPAARADMQLAIGQAYSFVGLTAVAESLFYEVIATRSALTPPRPLEVAVAREWLARTRMTRGNLEQGIADMKEVLATREAALGPNAVELVPALQRIALASHQRAASPAVTDTSLRMLGRAISILEAADSGETMAAAELHRLRAWLTQDRGKDAEALEIQRRAVEVATAAVSDPAHPALMNFKETYAIMLTANGHLDSAVTIHRSLLADRRRVFGAVHDNTSFSLFNLASVLIDLGQFDEAKRLIQECIAVREKVFGPGHPQTGYAVGIHAKALARSGASDSALALYRKAIAILEPTVGPTNASVMDRYEAIAILQVSTGRRADALATLETLVGRGYRNLSRTEFAPLAGDPRFRALSARVTRDST